VPEPDPSEVEGFLRGEIDYNLRTNL
jgi:hypothetical protein